MVVQVFKTAVVMQADQELFLLQDVVQEQLVVEEGTRTFQAWQKSPVPAYTEFYFFNMLNEEDFLSNRVKPILEEKGPYTFR